MAVTRVGQDIDHPDSILKCRSEIFRPAFLLLQLHRHWQSLGVGISRQQFEQMKARLGGKTPRAIFSPATRPLGALKRSEGGSSPTTQKIILGIDPSLRGTGYGIIKMATPFPETLAHGTISCPATWPHSRCLARISRTLREVLREYQPTVCAIEGLFFAQNLKTAIIMGEARGAAMAAIAEAGLDIFEIAPRKVKLAIVGYGAAQKSAVAKMVQRLLNLTKPPAPDAADALALALAHAQENGRYTSNAPKRI
jgi:crossover junction endodeoxyribonuclease RuvC